MKYHKSAPSTEELLSNLNKELPWSDESEKAVLSAMLNDPRLIGQSKLVPSAFYHSVHRTVYTELLAMNEADTPIDPVTLTNHLRDVKKLDDVGISTPIDLFTYNATGINYRVYLLDLQKRWQLRRHISAHAESLHVLFSTVVSDPDGILDALDITKGIIEAAGQDAGKRLVRVHIKDAIGETLDEVEERQKNGGKLPGFTTGFPTIDEKTSGLTPGRVTIFAGRPSDGKSTLMQNCAKAALRAGAKVDWYNLEMPITEQVLRIMSEDSGVDAKAIFSGMMTRAQQDMLQRSIRELCGMGAHMVRTDDANAQEILADMEKSDADIIVLDYLQLLEPGDMRKGATREEAVAMVSRRMKNIARKTGKHILSASQLNDQGQLRESRAIGQDADNVFMINKVMMENDKTQVDDSRRSLWCEKNRSGPRCWSLGLIFSGATYTFKEETRDE